MNNAGYRSRAVTGWLSTLPWHLVNRQEAEMGISTSR